MHRRHFLQYLGLLGLTPGALLSCSKTITDFYRPPAFGSARLLHFTDCHAQLLPIHYREPGVNLGVGDKNGLPPHLVGEQFLNYFGLQANTAEAHAYTCLNFAEAAHIFGKMGGFAYLMTVVKQLRELSGEQNTLLLDGGDSWQGSATALWTQGRDMVDAANLLGVDVMTGHWEFTHGELQVSENVKQFNGDFVAQNIALTEEAQFAADTDSDQVFEPYVIKRLPKANIAIIGQAFPYTPVANPQRLIPDWQFGIREQRLQQLVTEIRAAKLADAVILLSHNGMDVDLKLASRITGIDFILGGHTHDALPAPVAVSNSGGTTWVTNAGSHGKFLAVLDLDIGLSGIRDFRYRLIPVFCHLLQPDATMQKLITSIRRPYRQRLQESLAVTETLLYRRGNFFGTFDQLLLNAMMQVQDAEIALSPGFRWGTSLLPGQSITVEALMNQTAISYPETYVRDITGQELKTILEDVCDNLFNKDPYYRQGGDMVRLGGLTYRCAPNAEIGNRVSELRRTNGELIDARKTYKITGWASVGEKLPGRPIWDVVSEYLLDKKTIAIDDYRQPLLF